MPVTPDFGISNPGGPGGAGSPPTSAADATTVNSNNPVPVTAGMLTSMTALDDKVTLRAGDRISFRVIEDKDLAVPRIVTDTGEVD